MRRSQWLTSRTILSNWLTDTESEEKKKVSLENSTETFSSSPLLMGSGDDVVGLYCFGLNPLLMSEAPRTEFIDVAQVRDHWLGSRATLSNWRTATQNEDYHQVSLSYQPGSISASPLLFDDLVGNVGFQPFGLNLFARSNVGISIEEDLFDALATEDLFPITTELGDEITLG